MTFNKARKCIIHMQVITLTQIKTIVSREITIIINFQPYYILQINSKQFIINLIVMESQKEIT